MYTLFVTGGIGSGKSAFVARLAELGATVYDLDDISHEVLEDDDTVCALVAAFGPEILEQGSRPDIDMFDEGAFSRPDTMGCGKISRPALAWRAFSSPESTELLNSIVHPRVFRRLGELLASGCACCTSTRRVVNVVEVQLIDKVGESLALADEVLGILCPHELRRSNAQARGMDPKEFERRDALQITDEERARYCTHTLVNDAGLEHLLGMADDWWHRHQSQSTPEKRWHMRQEQTLKSPAIAFVGRHNSGKTTLVTQVIAQLCALGLDVGSVKHHGHRGFEVDVEGKDSWRHRQAGANEVAVASPDKMALMRELSHEMEVDEIIALMEPHDVVIVEGYRGSAGIPMVEIMRAANERDAVAAAEFVRAVRQTGRLDYDDANLGKDAGRMPDSSTVALASDIPEVQEAARSIGMRAFGLDDAPAIAEYIASRIAHTAR